MIIIILLILLFIAIIYIIFDKFNRYQQTKKIIEDKQIFQQGYQKGAVEAIITIAQQASTCNQVPLIIGNQTMNIIWVDCLRDLAQQQAQ